MDVVTDGGRLGGIVLELRYGDVASLGAEQEVSFTGVSLPGGSTVDLDLQRVPFDTSRMRIHTNGSPTPAAVIDPDLTLWKGRVRGAGDSYVFVSFSKYGSRGWIGVGGDVVHLLAGPGPDGDWARSTSTLIEESALAERGLDNDRLCALDRLPAPPNSRLRTAVPTGARSALATGVPLECRLAVETDYQLFTRFANHNAELVYLGQLLGAASDRYVEQINTSLAVIYLGTYTNAGADKWDTPEDPSRDAATMLYEFQNDWEGTLVQGGPAPNPANARPPAADGADLFHFLSGSALGGGVAYLPGVCNSPYNYGVSGDIVINIGPTPFPVVQGPMNWDFYVLTHETGHNFGTPHTQDFCPPLDQCWPSGGTGCTWSPVCSQGTLMSYCHLCPGVHANVIPYFHPQCVDLMRATAEACLLPISDGDAYCFGDGVDPIVTAQCPCGNYGSPGRGCANWNPALQGARLVSYGTVNPNTITLEVTGVPNNTLCTFFRGSADDPGGSVYGDGVRCFGGTALRFGSQISGQGGNPPNTVSAAPTTQTAGVTRYYQCQYRNPSPTFCPPELFNVSSGWKLTW